MSCSFYRTDDVDVAEEDEENGDPVGAEEAEEGELPEDGPGGGAHGGFIHDREEGSDDVAEHHEDGGDAAEALGTVLVIGECKGVDNVEGEEHTSVHRPSCS